MNKYLLLLVVFALVSCAKESDSLVNPPPKFETVKVRFLNLASDQAERSLIIESQTEIDRIAFAKVSSLVMPPADSVFLEVRKNGALETKTDLRFRFGRNTTYTFVALPSPWGSQNPKAVDTIVAFATSITTSTLENEAYVKIFNGYPDSTVSYSLNLGCPNGTSLASSLYYRKASPMAAVRTGEVPLSITKKTASGDSVLGLFAFNFASKNQYTILITDDGTGKERIQLLDDFNESATALSSPERISERRSEIRTINFSSEPVDLEKNPGGTVSQSVVPYFIDGYKQLEACESLSKDTLVVSNSGVTRSRVSLSLEVMERYTVAVFDSAINRSAKAVVVEPLRLSVGRTGKAVVRVVNGDYRQPSISLSAGAREIASAKGEDQLRGFRAGDALASALPFGSVGGAIIFNPGPLPLALFTSTEPARLITSSNFTLAADRNYLLVVYVSPEGEERLTLIEDETTSSSVQPADEGVFVQFVHATVGKDFVGVRLDGLFSNAKIAYTGSIATVVPQGTTEISVEGKSHSFNASSRDRVIVVSSGDASNVDIFDITELPLYTESNFYARRYINASKEMSAVDVRNSDSLVIMPSIAYGTRSSFEKIYQEKKFSLFFSNPQSAEYLARIDDLFLTYNKTYSLIFIGNKSKGYGLIIQQEY